ncbi:hypothetical protein [Pacificibacter maritimus]|nr:hypothetical protein [Pacificibacter maritimus]
MSRLAHMLFSCVGVFAGMAALPAFATCAGNQSTVFSCEIGVKTVELCLTPDESKLTYRFGASTAPELELTRAFGDITMRPWNGIGRAIWEEVTIHKGQFSYAVFQSFDKTDQVMSAGLSVHRGEQVLASLSCDGEPKAQGVFELDTVTQTMMDQGFCRDGTSDPLGQGACAE